MTLPRLAGFAEYWRDSPPVNELAAAWVKAQGGSDAPAKDLGELLAVTPQAG